jgi:hypothetical protein
MEMACLEPLWRAFSFEFERLYVGLRRKGSSGNVPVDEAFFFRARKYQAAYTDSSIIAFDETMLASAWQRKTDTSIPCSAWTRTGSRTGWTCYV